MICAIWFALLSSQYSFAQDNSTPTIETAVIEERAREIGQSLRCVVCQNQSIDESDAPLASDMRKLVRKRIAEGDSNADVIAYMRDKYGDYVLLKPPVQSNTYALWIMPFLLLLAGLVWFVLTGRKTANITADIADSQEQDIAQ
jgi:cytochrome c-type biogenesis protein CcmH